ncbi:hypothetical protein [Nocardia sp. CA-290969]|uniref:hypothetical protein n=1 Tax=Nocardia sp. CA-290969 TaxID=3239986 RepID=UPI003D8C31B4
MPAISEFYGIGGPVPFADVELSVDNRLFLDTYAIRLMRAPQPFADMANYCTDTFFKEVTGCVLSGSAADWRRGLDLLQHFVEPRETRLGMSARGINGHGGSEIVGRWIWDALINELNLLVRVGFLREIEAIPLFVKGIDKDIPSDLTTRLIYGPLAEFTAEMVATYPQFKSVGEGVTSINRQVWDPDARAWTQKSVTLPHVMGKPLLLVPKDWVRPSLLLSPRRFYETTILSRAQLEQAVERDGKLLKTPKDQLKRQAALARGRSTNLAVTLRAFEAEEENLIAEFMKFAAERYTLPGSSEAA